MSFWKFIGSMMVLHWLFGSRRRYGDTDSDSNPLRHDDFTRRDDYDGYDYRHRFDDYTGRDYSGYDYSGRDFDDDLDDGLFDDDF